MRILQFFWCIGISTTPPSADRRRWPAAVVGLSAGGSRRSAAAAERSGRAGDEPKWRPEVLGFEGFSDGFCRYFKDVQNIFYCILYMRYGEEI